MAVWVLLVWLALRLTGLVSVKATTVQVASFGPYSVKLIVPVGLVPRVRCATSDTCPPAIGRAPCRDGGAGPALVTTTASAESAQAVGPAALLFRSPE